ncbi:MAG: DNA cytosine methyltransferase [Cellulosilyticum sp.]|nr:DNA cytosine methyltransferase [Cellulosilyticum sp.]
MGLKVLELFGGIGACSKALEKAGIDYEIADYVEINEHAVRSFNAMHDTNFTMQDICKWDKDIEVDLIMHGSPCQDFSIIGQGAGGDIGSGTRSSLMYETIRIVKKLKPKYVVWENVRNLLGHKHRHNFDSYINILKDFGYNSYYQVLNACDYGLPQSRERVFTISIREDIDDGSFNFPKPMALTTKLQDVLEGKVPEEYYLSDYFKEQVRNTKYRKSLYVENTNKLLDGYFDDFKVMDYRYDEGLRIRKNGLCPTLTTRGKQSISGVPIFYQGKTLRFITPRECWRLMGFEDQDFDKASQVNSLSQLYKQAGNSIAVNVLMAIFKELLGGNI